MAFGLEMSFINISRRTRSYQRDEPVRQLMYVINSVSQRVVIAVALAAYRQRNVRLRPSLGIANRDVLAVSIGVTDHVLPPIQAR